MTQREKLVVLAHRCKPDKATLCFIYATSAALARFRD
jgi:hypothetical protein